jgi:diketogulonate reductase-like aldo/keto reductase
MLASIKDCTVLNNNVKMPWLGLGVFKMKEGDETENALRASLDCGYRSIDTAAIYRNEESVGRAIQNSGIPRDELFITTKVWNSDQGYETTLKAFDESRKKLQLDIIDLYLIHWPVKGKYTETWKALEKLYKDGTVRAIGLSNFLIHHIKDIQESCEIPPMVDQVEFHPQLRQADLYRYCRENKIQLEAWAPLGQNRSLKNPTIVEVAETHEKSPAQILIRWDLQLDVVTIPKSSKAERILENSQVFDFSLDASDMDRISRLDENLRFSDDPDNFDF